MRREWRNVLGFWGLFLAGSAVAAAPPEVRSPPGEAVRLTLDLTWKMPQTGATLEFGATGQTGGESQAALKLELSDGRVIEAISWPPTGWKAAAGPTGWGPGSDGGWRFGVESQGRVRARIEAPLESNLIVRGGDQVVSVPVAALLERPWHTPAPAPLSVAVERLPWDSLGVDLAPEVGEGIVAPGAPVPVSLGLNILWPEATEAAVRVTALLRPSRGGDALWQDEWRTVVPTNRRDPPVRVWNVTAPVREGTYVLEFHATWEPAGREGSRLGRLIRRRKPGTATTSAVRRVVLTVLDPQAAGQSGSARRDGGRESEVDSVDLTRSRSHRPLASGRSPLLEPGSSAWTVPAEALIEPSRRDRLVGWLFRSGAEASQLDPADGSGLAWSAVGLKVPHPDRPHRLTLTIKGGEPAALGVALIEPGDGRTARPPRLLLDACASGPPILQHGPALAFTWLVWPGTTEAVLVLVNRDPGASVRLGTVALTELDDLPPGPVIPEPETPSTRTLGLYFHGPHALDPFAGEPGAGDAWIAARNLGRYLGYCGASAVVLPEDLADRRARRALEGQADEDSTGSDRLELVRRVLARQGGSLWLEVDFDGPGTLPGLPPSNSAEAVRRGLVRLDGQGHAEAAAYHPLHPAVRAAMRRRVAEALSRFRTAPGGGIPASRTRPGLVIRMGPGPTLLGAPETGADDLTFERFVRETFSPETARGIPGRGDADPERFGVRVRYLAGVGRMPWLSWRARAMASLYAELAGAAQEAAPGAVLAVVTPGLDRGPAGREARRVDLAGLAPSQAWRSVGLDLPAWPSGPLAPLLLRGATLSTDIMAYDLATSPDLDALVAARPQRGLLLTSDALAARPPAGGADRTPVPPAAIGATVSPAAATDPGWNAPGVRLTALPLGNGSAADEPLAHALAALDAHSVFLAGSAVAGHEERLRRYARVLRALPAWPARSAESSADPHAMPPGIVVRRMGDATQTFLAIANDSPYPIRLACLLAAPASARVEDLGRGLQLSPAAQPGGRSLVLDLLPFGVSAIRIGAPQVEVATLTSYHSEAVLTGMQARFRELSAQLARVNRTLSAAAAAAAPANPRFEPESPPPDPAGSLPPLPPSADPGPPALGTGTGAGSGPGSAPIGWHVEEPRSGGGGSPGAAGSPTAATIVIDRENPHSGQGCLRLAAPAISTSIVSDPFVPNAQSRLTIQAFFRAAPADARIRVWIEGDSGGQPYVRRSELSVSSEWDGLAVRASDLPPGGLDSARLRFEMMTPGTLWIDDLQIESDPISRAARLNAQRTLLAALQAYREQRYAEFARLSASHWVRPSSASAWARMAGASNPDATPPGTETGRAGPGDAAASALPPDRTLR